MLQEDEKLPSAKKRAFRAPAALQVLHTRCGGRLAGWIWQLPCRSSIFAGDGPAESRVDRSGVRQDALEALLENALASLGVKVRWNHELSRLQSRPESAVATVRRLVMQTVGYAVARTAWNAGLGEAYDLASLVAEILRDGRSSDCLRAYGERQLAQWRRLFAPASDLQSGYRADPWVVEHSGRILACLPASGDELVELAGQLHLGPR